MPGSRIRLVEDEPDILKMVQAFLKKWKFDSDAFGNPVEALAHFEKNSLNYFLVMTDVRMPA